MSVHDLLESAYLGNITRPKEIQTLLSISDEVAADLCFVSPQTFRRWNHDRAPNRCAMKLLGILAGYVPWPGWEKFYYNPYDQMLYSHDLKYGFSPGDLHTLHYMRQGYELLQRENQQLKEKLKDLENLEASRAELEASRNVVLFPNLRGLMRTRPPAPGQADTTIQNPKPRWLQDTVAGFIRRMVK